MAHVSCRTSSVHATLTLTLTLTQTQAPAKGSGQGGMPTDFLGFIDVNTGFGSLAASLIVAGGQG